MDSKRIVFRLESREDATAATPGKQYSKKSRRLLQQSEAYLETQVAWALFRRTGYMDVTYSYGGRRVNYLCAGITEQAVLAALNGAHAFLWDYTPQEGDSLILRLEYRVKAVKLARRPEQGDSMCFRFSEQLWAAESISAIYETVLLASGVVAVA